MRLKELRERDKSLTSYQAESATFHNDVDGDLNEALEEVWTYKHWTFRERVVAIDILPDVLPSNSRSIDVTAANDSRYVEGFSLPDLWPDRNLQATPDRTWIGQTLHIYGRDYTIQEVQGEGSDDAIITTEPVRLPSGSSDDTGEWELRFTHLRLPADCQEILGLVDADTPLARGSARGKLVGLAARRAEEVDLRVDVTGEPECYVVEPPLVVPAAGTTTAAWVAGAVDPVSDTHGFSVHRWYEVTWAYAIGGRIGPLAEPATVEMKPSGTHAGHMLVSMFEADGLTPAECANQDFANQPYPLSGEGLRKVLFSNTNIDPTTGERLGLPCWTEITAAASLAATQVDAFPLTCIDVESALQVNQPKQMLPKNKKLTRDPDGVHLQVRLWPRPTTGVDLYDEADLSVSRTAPKVVLKRYLLRYLARPPKLCEASDTPAMPTEFHQVVLWKAVAVMLRRCGDAKMADDYEKRATNKMDSLVNAHTHRADIANRRGGWSYEDRDLLPRNVLFTEN